MGEREAEEGACAADISAKDFNGGQDERGFPLEWTFQRRRPNGAERQSRLARMEVSDEQSPARVSRECVSVARRRHQSLAGILKDLAAQGPCEITGTKVFLRRITATLIPIPDLHIHQRVPN